LTNKFLTQMVRLGPRKTICDAVKKVNSNR
jgi:hypothetical protein